MSLIEIRRVSTKRDLKKFINFQFALYKGNPYWCPPLKFDEIKTLRKDMNPAFEYCEAEYWLAYKDGKIAGRIAGIISHHEIRRWNKKLVRFGWIDFIDDPDVSHRLIKTVTEWGKSKGMEGIHGPLGFTDMDPEGMLMDGFDSISSLAAIYNYPYYKDHMEHLGMKKAVDWVQFEVKIPERIPEKVDRLTQIVLNRFDLRILKARKKKEVRPYAAKMFNLYNTAFHDIYGFTALTARQIEYYTRIYFGFIRPEFLSLVLDKNDDVVGFGVTMPGLSEALQKANGSLFPFGFFHLLKALRKNNSIHMYLVGVHPEYQGKGVLALVFNELNKSYVKAGIKLARTHPQLEDNYRAISIWKNYDSKIYIRRRCWIRSF